MRKSLAIIFTALQSNAAGFAEPLFPENEDLRAFDLAAYNYCLGLESEQRSPNPPPRQIGFESYQDCYKGLKDRYTFSQALETDPDIVEEVELDVTPQPASNEPVDKFTDLDPGPRRFDSSGLFEIDVEENLLPAGDGHLDVSTEITVARLDDDFSNDLASIERQLMVAQLDRERREAEQAERQRIARIEAARRAEQRRQEALRQAQLAEQRRREEANEPNIFAGFALSFAGALLDQELADTGYSGPSIQRQVTESYFGATLPSGSTYIEQTQGASHASSTFNADIACNARVSEAANNPLPSGGGICQTARASIGYYEQLASAYAICGPRHAESRQQMLAAAEQSRQSAAAACSNTTPNFPSQPLITGTARNTSLGTQARSDCKPSPGGACTAQ